MPVTSITQKPATDDEVEGVLVFLHGQGQCNGEPEPQVKTHGPWLDLPNNRYSEREIKRLYVIALHLSGGQSWITQLDAANTELNNHLKQNCLKGKPIYITGLNIGGEGAIALANLRLQNKQPVSAMAAFCPHWTGGTPGQRTYKLVAQIPSYIFCHRGDSLFDRYRNGLRFAEQLGPNCQFREISDQELDYPEHPHVCWPGVYRCPDFYRALTALPARLWKDRCPRPNAQFSHRRRVRIRKTTGMRPCAVWSDSLGPPAREAGRSYEDVSRGDRFLVRPPPAVPTHRA